MGSTEQEIQAEKNNLLDQQPYRGLLLVANSEFSNGEYEKCVDSFADILHLLEGEPDFDPFEDSLAPIYYSYGVSLLNNYTENCDLLNDGIEEKLNPNFENGITDHDSSVSDSEGGQEEDTDCKDDDLSLSWEALEMSRIIYQKILSKISESESENKNVLSDKRKEDLCIKLSKVFIALGDVSIESEHMDTAYEDYSSAVSTIKNVSGFETDRSMAELYYKVSIPLELNNREKEAIEYINKAKDILRDKIKMLKMNNVPEDEEETKDMELLVVDLEEKVEEIKRRMKERVKESSACENKSEEEKKENSPNDLSLLVKRKKVE